MVGRRLDPLPAQRHGQLVAFLFGEAVYYPRVTVVVASDVGGYVGRHCPLLLHHFIAQVGPVEARHEPANVGSTTERCL